MHYAKTLVPIVFLSASLTAITLGQATAKVESGVGQCNKYAERDKKAYKRCLAYFDMAGTPSQREDAGDRIKKERASRDCHYVQTRTVPLRVCKSYKTRREREAEEARKHPRPPQQL